MKLLALLVRKSLQAARGRYNFTHGGSIKNFPERYISSDSNASSFIRPSLYKFNNIAVIQFFEKLGIPSYVQEDGRFFPYTDSSLSIRNALVDRCRRCSCKFSTNSTVLSVDKRGDCWIIRTDREKILATSKLIVATGGPAWKGLGRGDRMTAILAGIGLKVIAPVPALTQINIKHFDLEKLSGISFDDVKCRILKNSTGKLIHTKSGSLLITENGFSGPLALNISTLINKMKSNSLNDFSIEFILPAADYISMLSFDGINSNLVNSIRKLTELPERYIKHFTNEFSNKKASSVPAKIIRNMLYNMYTLHYDSESIVFPSFNAAMSSLGGVSTNEVNKKSFQCNSLEGIYIIGEALDITADTGGYNLQLAWSSAHTAAFDLICHP